LHSTAICPGLVRNTRWGSAIDGPGFGPAAAARSTAARCLRRRRGTQRREQQRVGQSFSLRDRLPPSQSLSVRELRRRRDSWCPKDRWSFPDHRFRNRRGIAEAQNRNRHQVCRDAQLVLCFRGIQPKHR